MRLGKNHILILLITLVSVCGCNFIVQANPPAPINSISTIIQDMRGSHDARPHGVPDSYDWSASPRMGLGNNPGNLRAITAWGQLYIAEQGNPAINTRVQLRNIKTYVLSQRDRRWRLIQSSRGVEGEAYREDFDENISRAADVRQEADGTLSVTAGQGYNFHFWPEDGRVTIDPTDIAGVFTTVQARLIVGNSSQPDDRALARYVLSVGADYWLSLTAPWELGVTPEDVAIGKFKYVRSNWQSFNMSTLSPAELRQTPPPLE